MWAARCTHSLPPRASMCVLCDAMHAGKRTRTVKNLANVSNSEFLTSNSYVAHIAMRSDGTTTARRIPAARVSCFSYSFTMDGALVQAPKRPRTEAPPGSNALVNAPSSSTLAVHSGLHRTSSLDAPIMLLTGHADSVNGIKFSPNGASVATCGADKMIYLWNVRGDCEVRGTQSAQ